MRLTLKLAAIAAIVAASTSAPRAALVPTAVAPTLASIGTLAFGPNGVLYVADPQAATIFALNLGAQGAGAAQGTGAVTGLDQKIAATLGTEANLITIADVAVNPASRNTFVSVMRGQGPDARPAIFRIDGAGKLDLVSLDTVQFTSVTLPNPADAVAAAPAGGAAGARGGGGGGRGGGRTQSVTDMALVNGRLYVAGLSNEEFRSKLWSVAYPFQAADRGTSVEIYHGNHGRVETNSPIMTFLPLTVSGQASIIAGYTCTPLVRFGLNELPVGQKVVGKTLMDLGAGNQPLDMISYTKGGQEYVLIANSRYGIVRVPTAQFATLPAITAQVNTAGQFEAIAALPGVVQLDKLDAQKIVTVATGAAGAGRDLAVVDLP